MDYSNLFVCLMGMGTVFFGLICLIVLTTLMGRIVGHGGAPQQATPAAAPIITTPVAAPEPDRQQLAAAVSAAIAEELGTDITGIRILSMKKV
jgi:sodium pump decarboxylase gamma subunit